MPTSYVMLRLLGLVQGIAPHEREQSGTHRGNYAKHQQPPAPAVGQLRFHKYIQHNLRIGDGLSPILAFMDALPPERTRADVVRAFEDGDYSVAHANYELGDWGPMVGFEVHRWEDDRDS